MIRDNVFAHHLIVKDLFRKIKIFFASANNNIDFLEIL